VLAGAVAVVPIAIGIVAALSGGSGGTPARTAFATAPSGHYAVVARNEPEADVIWVAPADDPSSAIEVARVPHLPGYASTGAVSPDGARLALVTVESGSPAHPVAALNVVELETGALTRLAADVDELQVPVWSPAGDALVVTRTEDGEAGAATVATIRIAADGAESELSRRERVLGSYPVAFDPAGMLVEVVIDGRGSTLVRGGREVLALSTHVTRDWQLSPDGAALAFIEANLDGGLQYLARTATIEGAGLASAQAAPEEGQALGVSWRPGDSAPTFGREPGTAAGTALAQVAADAPGFDVPLAYAPDGQTLAVQHWSGSSFAEPGRVNLEVVGMDGRRTGLAGFGRFYGWAAR
jgi:hypothetical protein